MCLVLCDERSDRGKPKVFRGSARSRSHTEALPEAEAKSRLCPRQKQNRGSAHEGKSLDAYEVEAALIIVEFLLKKIYLLPAIQRDLERGKEKFSIDEVFGDESPEVVSNEQ